MGKMAKEGSKERERFHQLEMAFTAVEIAFKTQKAVVDAVASITSAGQGDPYTAIPRALAMAALMRSLWGAPDWIGLILLGGLSATGTAALVIGAELILGGRASHGVALWSMIRNLWPWRRRLAVFVEQTESDQ